MAAKEETGGRDDADEPASEVSISAPPKPNTPRRLPDVTYAENALLSEVIELETLGTESKFEAVEARILDLYKLTDELHSSDKCQEQAESALDDAVGLTSIASHEHVAMDPCITGDSIEEPQPPICPQLEAYHTAVSTLRNMGERIGDLQDEQQEQWVRRDMMWDQGQVLEQSEDEFLRHWNEILSIAYQDFTRVQRDVSSAREACEAAGVMIPTWAEINSGEQEDPEGAGGMEGEPPSLDDPEAKPVSADRIARWYEPSEKGHLERCELCDDTSTPHTTPAWAQLFSDTRKKRPCNPSRLAWLCLPLITAAVPLGTDGSNELMDQNALPSMTELGGLQYPDDGQNVVREVLSTASEYTLAILPPLILIGGIAGSAWILTRKKRPFERQQFLFLMTSTASVSWWVLAATAPNGGSGGAVSISAWLALAVIYISRNHRGLRNGTWHLFVAFFGGLAITSLFALALLTAKEALMERFIQNCLLVGPSTMTVWSWLAARGQRELEGSANAVADESIELQGLTDTIPQ